MEKTRGCDTMTEYLPRGFRPRFPGSSAHFTGVSFFGQVAQRESRLSESRRYNKCPGVKSSGGSTSSLTVRSAQFIEYHFI